MFYNGAVPVHRFPRRFLVRTTQFILVLALMAFVGSAEVVFARKVVNKAVNSTATLPAPNANNNTSGGIREVIPDKYQKRYQEWKQEFLSADIARQQWDMYAHNSRLTLTITISDKNETGAGSGKYKWNDAGELIAATITLGSRIDQGFPTAVYYPVMNALRSFESPSFSTGHVLAATKLAHEFGHVMKISTTPKDLYNLQVQLVPVYNQIFLQNGYNVNDPRLIELARKMGGNPVQIWEDREYWGEANAMLFLRDRVAKERFHCRLFGKIKQTVDEYAKDYEERFAEIARSQNTTSCNWK